MEKMKGKKRWLCMILCLVMCLPYVPLSAASAEEAALNMDVRQDGQGVIITVNLESAKSVAAVQFTLKYDENLFELENAKLQNEYNSMMNAINTQEAGEVILAAASAFGINAEGAVMEVALSLKDGQSAQNTSFLIEDAIVGDESGNVLMENGSAYAQVNLSPSGNEEENRPGELPDSGVSGDDNNEEESTDPLAEAFRDVKGHWAYDFIIDAYEKGLMEGYGDHVFGPDDSITRAQMAVALWNSAGNPKPSGSSPFTDLEKDWYRDAVVWASEQGLVKGTGNGLYNPDGTLTREHLAQILFNQAGGAQGVEVMLTAIYDGQYKDSDQVSAWAKPALYWSVYQGILCGTDSLTLNDILSPKSPASRAQIAVMLVRSDAE